jgi:GntR family transcriptional regulator/MocR family aminotransferase
MRRASLPLFIERGTKTLQERIYHGIRQSILDGLVSADQCLPSTRSLAADLGVSRTTALLALEQLQAEGYLIARPGSGTFIAPRLPVPPPTRVNAPGKPIARPPFSRRGQLLARMQAPDRRANVPRHTPRLLAARRPARAA